MRRHHPTNAPTYAQHFYAEDRGDVPVSKAPQRAAKKGSTTVAGGGAGGGRRGPKARKPSAAR